MKKITHSSFFLSLPRAVRTIRNGFTRLRRKSFSHLHLFYSFGEEYEGGRGGEEKCTVGNSKSRP